MQMLYLLEIFFCVNLKRIFMKPQWQKVFNRIVSCRVAGSNPNLVLIYFVLIINFCDGFGVCTKSQNVPQENIKKLASAINQMSLNLHKRIAENATGNVLHSPLSIAAAFEMVSYGTRGQTAVELRKILGYEDAGLPNNLVHQTFHHILCKLEMVNHVSSDYTLTVANAILFDKRMDLLPHYKSEVENLYQAFVQNVDFAKVPTAVVQRVNNWVEEQTNGKIQKLIDRLNKSAFMIILNAVYFKGTWLYQFNVKHTTEKLFYNDGLESKARLVPTMHIQHYFRFYEDFEDCSALEMPYKGDNISMLILLPSSRNGLSQFEKSLTIEKLTNIHRTMNKVYIEVAIPKFKFMSSRELKQDLQAMGANRIFDVDMSNFSGMSTSNKVYITDVLHKAYVEVNEEGSVAAAATGLTFSARNIPPSFTVDHPFLFAILDKGSGATLVILLGRVSHLD